MQKRIIRDISNLVEETCKKKSNYYGYRAWSHHILSVVKYSKILARRLHAEEEVVEIAALLHDYASVKNKKLHPKHHIYSARFAEKILAKHNYSKDKIEKVKHGILSHRGSKNI